MATSFRYVARVEVSLVHDTGRSKGKRFKVEAGKEVPSSVGHAQARLLVGSGLLAPAGPAPVVSKDKTEKGGAPSSPAEPPAGNGDDSKGGSKS
jgi:hypothetical protein